MIHRFSQSDSLVLPQQHSFRSDVERENPLYQVYDTESADIATVLKLAQEMIHVSGASVKVHTRTSNNDIIDTHDEDPDPTYWQPEFMKAFFVPQPLEWELTEWGVDTENSSEVVFFLGDVVERFNNRLLRTGDLIELPYGSQSMHRPRYYYVNNGQEFGNYRYTWLYFKCHTILIPGDVNIRPAGDNAMQMIEYEDPHVR